MIEQYQKIMIFGQPFNGTSGGGITLTNLFKGWPKDKIAVAFAPWGNGKVTTDICNIYYQIGEEEHRWKFPYNLFKKPFPKSGLIEYTAGVRLPAGELKTGLKKILADRVYNPLMFWLGFHHCNSEIIISEKLMTWLGEFQPDILYLQVSSLENIRFANRLIDYLKVPAVIHMMDDWPSTISTHGPLKNFWKNKINREFRQLLNKVSLHLGISDGMSEEYLKRYNKCFKAFHNPVEIQQFNIPNKRNPSQINCFRILYIGRIGTANKETIVLFASLISQLLINHIKIEFDIFTVDIDSPDIRSIKNFENVNIRPAIAHEKIPALLAEYDLLLLPLDFTENGIRFARFSIPTKASEYMLSGTPVLVFAPQETAVSKFFSRNDCGYCLTSQNRDEIIKAIKFLISNEEYRKKISRNAVNFAKEKFDAEKVRKEFQSLLMELSTKQI